MHRWDWAAFQALPQDTPTVDLHCVTSWSKLQHRLAGRLARHAAGGRRDHRRLRRHHVVRRLHDQPAAGGPARRQAWVAYRYDGDDLDPAHGGPARLLVPHLYLWKSAKWVRDIRLSPDDEPGFWETAGYHNYGDPWREQRYWDS